MKNKFIKIFVFLFLLISASTYTAQAQNYKSAIGVRLGRPLSVSFKTFVSENNALELYAGFRGNSSSQTLSLNAAYLVHRPLDQITDGLQWYAGGGAGAYLLSSDFFDSVIFLGVQGYIGLDYKFEDTPVNITLDWSPTFLFRGSSFSGGYYSAGVRYTLGE